MFHLSLEFVAFFWFHVWHFRQQLLESFQLCPFRPFLQILHSDAY